MTSLTTQIDQLDWEQIGTQLDLEGYVLLPGLLTPLLTLPDDFDSLRCVSLASADLGRGEIRYFRENLPEPLSAMREALYPHLARVANHWNDTLDVAYRYPDALQSFLKRNRHAGQLQGISHLNRLGDGDYLALHQRADNEVVFPLQLIGLFSSPNQDFTGGEFVMTEQRPRMQSRPMVLPLAQGDAALICTAQRPFKGSKGYYRVNLKHAISRVRSGQRIGLELSFHDAA